MTPSCPSAEQLRHALADNLGAQERETLEAHVETCTSCQQEIDRLVANAPTWSRAATHLGGSDAMEPALEGAVRELESSAVPHSTPTDGDTEAGPQASLAEELSFLAPPAQPGHLGRLGHYEVIEVVGRGGMGVVLKARDERLQRIVAIKVLGGRYAGSGSARRRFQREAKAAAAVSHDHVVPIYHVDEIGGVTFLVMPLIVGKSLEERIDATGPLQLEEVLRIGMQIAQGLAAAHAQGLVHRDIKPANILLENGVERVKITDFGLARAVDDASMTQSGVITGTPMFMSPEQARGELLIDHRSDLFSLGSVLYTMATGRPPFRASGSHATLKRVIDDTPRPMHEINPDVPAWLEAIVARLHAKDPQARFTSAREVADLLGQHLAHLQEPHRVAPPPSLPGVRAAVPKRSRWGRRLVMALLSIPLAFVALAILFVFLRLEREVPVPMPPAMVDEPPAPRQITVLPAGQRAVGVLISAEDAAVGFRPGARVDVLSTSIRVDKATARLLLEDVLVAAVDTPARTGHEQHRDVVTLAVKPEDALKLALAKQMGKLNLLLRATAADAAVDAKHALVLPPGHRAMGLTASADQARWLQPMSRIDVIATVRRGHDQGSTSRVLLEDVLVIKLDTRRQRDEQGEEAVLHFVVLALTPEDARKLAEARALGSLELLLRAHQPAK